MELLSIPTLFEKSFKKYKNNIAVSDNDIEYSYEEIWQKASDLKDQIVKDSDGKTMRVGLLMENHLKYVVCELAIIQARATRVGLNTLLSLKEIEYILNDAEIEILFVDQKFLSSILKLTNQLKTPLEIIVVDQNDYNNNNVISWDRYINRENKQSIMREPDKADISIIAYTGGTTGESKGVILTQEKLFMCLTTHIIETELKSTDHVLLITPFAHSAGMILLTSLLAGAKVYIESKFDVKKVIHQIEKGITFTFMVPTMIYRLLDEVRNKSTKEIYDFTSLKTILYGAAPMMKSRLKEGIEIFGSVFVQLYGQTESYNFITRLTKEDHISQNDSLLKSCGRPTYMTQIKIVNDSGMALPILEVGEVIVKSPYNMAYYLNKSIETEKTLKDGWLYTGDIGYVNEDGYLFLLDRKADLIISGGFNVYSTEVENVIQTHSKVSQVAILGIADKNWGEKVVAAVIPKEGEVLTSDEMKVFSESHLSKYKQPKSYYFLTSLPVTPFGKVNKKLLRNQLQKEHHNEKI